MCAADIRGPLSAVFIKLPTKVNQFPVIHLQLNRKVPCSIRETVLKILRSTDSSFDPWLPFIGVRPLVVSFHAESILYSFGKFLCGTCAQEPFLLRSVTRSVCCDCIGRQRHVRQPATYQTTSSLNTDNRNDRGHVLVAWRRRQQARNVWFVAMAAIHGRTPERNWGCV